MPKPDSAFVYCQYCTRGGNGDHSCAAGWTIKRGVGGCFLGILLPGKAKANTKKQQRKTER